MPTATNSRASDSFRANLRRLLEERGITMQTFAEMIGSSRPNISRILSGTEGVTLDRAERIADALGVNLHDLLGKK